MKIGLVTILVLVCLGGCGSSMSPNRGLSQSSSSLNAAQNTVEFKYRDLMDEPLETSQFSGRVVVISYFAAWCTECLEQLPRFNALLRDIPESDAVEVIAVSVDRNPKNELPPLLSIVRPLFKVALADEASLYGRTPMGDLIGVPTTYLIDKKGYLTETLRGEVPMQYLRRRVLELMDET